MKAWKFSMNTDRLLGLSAIMISLLTLFIFFYQTNLLEKQSRLSVRPRLTFSKTIDKTILERDSIIETTISIKLNVRNNGLGPAIIEDNRIRYKGQTYDIISFFDEVFPRLKELGTFTRISDLNVGGAVPSSETVNIISYDYDQKNEEDIMAYLGVSQPYEFPFGFLVEYSSLYEERWEVSSNSDGHPTQLE